MRLRRSLLAAVCMVATVAVAPPAPIVGVYRGSYSDATDATSYTVTAAAIGTAAADRSVKLAFASGAGANITVVSVTIGGVTATPVVTEAATSIRIEEIWEATVPTGTTADIVVTFSGTANRFAAHWWTTTGGASLTYAARSAANTELNGAANSLSTTAMTVPTGGFTIAAARIGSSAAPDIVWSQTSGSGTSRTDVVPGGEPLRFGAYDTTAVGSQQFTADGVDGSQYRIAAASWA